MNKIFEHSLTLKKQIAKAFRYEKQRAVADAVFTVYKAIGKKNYQSLIGGRLTYFCFNENIRVLSIKIYDGLYSCPPREIGEINSDNGWSICINFNYDTQIQGLIVSFDLLFTPDPVLSDREIIPRICSSHYFFARLGVILKDEASFMSFFNFSDQKLQAKTQSKQILDLLQQHPYGLTGKQIAKITKIKSVYSVLSRLKTANKVWAHDWNPDCRVTIYKAL